MKTAARILLLVLAAGLLGYFAAGLRPGARKERESTPAPNLTLPDLAGKPVSLSDFKGQVVLLDFWATWCEPCQEEIPVLKSLYAKYKDRGLVVLGVSVDEAGAKTVAPFAKRNNINYPVLLVGADPPEGYPVYGLPAAFLIDRKGFIVQEYLGPQTYGDFARDIEAVLER